MKITKINVNEPVRRFFDCRRCGLYLSKFIPKYEKNVVCGKCNNRLKELSENEYQKKLYRYIQKETSKKDYEKKNKTKYNNKNEIIDIKIKTNKNNQNKIDKNKYKRLNNNNNEIINNNYNKYNKINLNKNKLNNKKNY